MRNTALLAIPVPGLDDPPNVPLHLGDVADQMERFTVPRFATVAERDSKWTAPPAGALALTTDFGLLWRRTASAWVLAAPGPRVSASRSVAQNLGTAAWGSPSWVETSDPFGMHDDATNPTRFTIPAGMAGWWLCVASLAFASNATGLRGVGWQINGAATQWGTQLHNAISGSMTITSTALLVVNAGDYVELFAYQSSGATLSIGGGNSWAHLAWNNPSS